MPDALWFDAVLFDLDGVLVDSTQIVRRHWERWARRHGHDAEEILEVAHGRPILETLRLVAPALATPEEAGRLAAAEAADVDGLRLVPGVVDLLSRLPEDLWAIVTSGARAVATARIQSAGLPMPRVLVTADDVSRGKPAPDPYLLAARKLAVRADRCLVVEDAPAGLQAAAAAGMYSIAIAGTFPRTALTDASRIVDRIEEIDIRAERVDDPRIRVHFRD